MLEVFKQLMKNTYAMKKETIRHNLINYYMSLAKEDVMIPAFILANEDVKLIEHYGKVEECYKRILGK